MNTRIKLSAELYNLNEVLALKALNEATPATLEVRPMDKANSFAWVFGHIVNSRFHIAKAIGLDEKASFDELYSMGSDVRGADAYPSVDELKTAYADITGRLKARLEKLTDSDLDGAPAFKVPGIEESVAGLISFMAFHEAYHIGQLAYIQRLHGGPKLVG
jgi:uncharacterized damage-inducible protein DinB